MPSEEEITAQQELLRVYRRTLHIFLTQLAEIGHQHAPPGLLNSIREYRQQIRHVKEQLRQWGVEVDEIPGDSESSADDVPDAFAQPVLNPALQPQARGGSPHPNWLLIGGLAVSALLFIGIALLWRNTSPPVVPGSDTLTVPSDMPQATSEPIHSVRQTQEPAATAAKPQATIGGLLVPSSLTSDDETINTVVFSPDGKQLATCAGNGFIRVWDVASQQQVWTGRPNEKPAASVAWSPDGKRLVSGSDDYMVYMWDLTASTPVSKTLGAHSNAVLSVAWSSDGQWIASTGLDQQVIVWNAVTRAVEGKVDLSLDGLSVAWAPNSERFAVASVGHVRIYDTKAKKLLQKLSDLGGDVHSVAWSRDGKYLAATTNNNTISVWEVDTWQIVRKLQGHTSTVTSISWSPDSRFIASASYDHTVRVWDVAGGGEHSLKLASEGRSGLSTDWAKVENQLASSGEYKILIWDTTEFN